MRHLLSAVGLCALLIAAPLAAQPELVKPGPEHDMLKEGAGVWDATVKAGGGEVKGELFCKMAPGGLWAIENFKMDFGGMAFEGYGATSYDPAKKKYVNVWIDSMVPTPMVTEGTYDKDKKTLTLVGTMTHPGGKTEKATISIHYKDANAKVLSITTEGKDAPMVEIAYKRRAVDKK